MSHRLSKVFSFFTVAAIGALVSACSAAGDDGSQSGDEAITGAPGDQRPAADATDSHAYREWRLDEMDRVRVDYAKARASDFQPLSPSSSSLSAHFRDQYEPIAARYGYTELHRWDVAGTERVLWVLTAKKSKTDKASVVYFFASFWHDETKRIDDEIGACNVLGPNASLEGCSIELG